MQQQCPNCGFRNRLGIVFCENCGASLIGESPINTRNLPDNQTLPQAVSEAVASKAQEGILTDNTLLRLEIDGGKEPIVFKPGHEIILGRRDPATGAMPDVDLTPFAGYRMGVSRRHAALRPNDSKKLDLWDLGSSNGTFLNGARLGAHRPYRLRDGDEIRLGQMVMHLYFQSPQGVVSAKPSVSAFTAESQKSIEPAPEPIPRPQPPAPPSTGNLPPSAPEIKPELKAAAQTTIQSDKPSSNSLPQPNQKVDEKKESPNPQPPAR